MGKTYKERSAIAVECLPESPYRDMLLSLLNELNSANDKLLAENVQAAEKIVTLSARVVELEAEELGAQDAFFAIAGKNEELEMLKASLAESVNIHCAMFETARVAAADAIKEMRLAAEYLVSEGIAPILREKARSLSAAMGLDAVKPHR